jgi:xanthine dehydrogenase accessory factor
MTALILIRGGGDLASGVALRLVRSGLKVLVSELAKPLAVRRKVSLAEAVYAGEFDVEGIKGQLVRKEQIPSTLQAGYIPVLVDPEALILNDPSFHGEDAPHPIVIVIDARLTKHPPEALPVPVDLLVGLGPGFEAGRNCDAVIETRRSHTLGRVYWHGVAQPDSGTPEGDPQRVLRAPVNGSLKTLVEIGDHVEAGQPIAEIIPESIQIEPPVKVHAPFTGVLRGLIHPDAPVQKGLKIGDVDGRDDPEACRLISDKALAIGGGVLEAILSRTELREKLWE